MSDFILGFSYPLRAVGFVQREGLGRWIMAPLFLSVLLYFLFLGSLWLWFPELVNTLWQKPLAEGAWGSLLVFLWQTFRGALAFLVVGLGLLLLIMLHQILAAPFHERLSEKTEEILLGASPRKLTLGRALTEIGYAVKDLFRWLLFFVLLNGGLLFLHLLPGVGSGLHALVNGLAALLVLAYEFFDYPLSRRQVPFFRKWRMVLKKPLLSLGFGAGVFTLLLFPGSGPFLLPFACVGGTMLFCDNLSSGKTP
jgi:CysZ protein